MSLKQESLNQQLLERLEKLEKIVAELAAQKREILRVKKPNA
jgi:uncharacterized protein (UPF0335 family)